MHNPPPPGGYNYPSQEHHPPDPTAQQQQPQNQPGMSYGNAQAPQQQAYPPAVHPQPPQPHESQQPYATHPPTSEAHSPPLRTTTMNYENTAHQNPAPPQTQQPPPHHPHRQEQQQQQQQQNGGINYPYTPTTNQQQHQHQQQQPPEHQGTNFEQYPQQTSQGVLNAPHSNGVPHEQPPVPTPGQQQLTHAQLSPALVNPTEQAQAPAASQTTVEKVEKKISSTIQSIFSPEGKTSDGRNVGFKPTSRLAALHEKNVRGPEGAAANDQTDNGHALYQFQVTKLRSWRTGYERLLVLSNDGTFSTLDPSHETPSETNRWKYSALREWLAIPKENDTILLQVEKDRLKFTCHNVHRSLVLTALLQCQDESGQAPAGETIVFGQVQRQTRHGTLVNVSLHVKAYGIVEINPETNERIQTYRYADIRACSFTSPNNDNTGLVFYLDPIAVGKSRLYFIHSSRQGGNGRSDMLTLMRENCEVLGIELPMEESLTAPDWLDRRRKISVGTIATSWPVNKNTRRHDARYVGSVGWVGGIVTRQLALTGQGYLVERDGEGIVSCRRMADLFSVVRHANSGEFTLEFTNGLTRTYTSSNRDALIVSILDAAMTLGNNQTVHVTDVLSAGFCLQSFSSFGSLTNEVQTSSGGVASSLFHPTFIPRYCLRRVNALATQCFAFVSRAFEHFQQGQPIDIATECQLVVEACREFNANVLPSGEGLPTSPSDKQISGSIGALWGLVSKLLERPPNQDKASSVHNTRESAQAEQLCSTFFQTLFRLSQTPTGYKVSAELSTLQESIPLLFSINDVFCKFWAFQVLKVLLSGLPERDQETEYVNKSVVFRAGGQTLIEGLVNALLEPSAALSSDGRKDQVSDMVLMVSSDILQSILCTYHDTTTPETFSQLINALADRYRALLNTLRSPTPSVIENTALLIHLLSTHAPATAAAIRDAALSSAILLQHFFAAIFSPLEGQRFLSRYLCSLWLSGPMDCDEKRLLKRMVPHGFLAYLAMPPLSQVEEEQLDELEHGSAEESIREARQESSGDTEYSAESRNEASQQGAAGTNTARLRSRISLAVAMARKNSQAISEENFRIFFHVLSKDHSLPDLIWSQQTRRELRIALESEIQYVQREVEARGMDSIAWNHQQFRVKYPSLDNEVKVGNVYMRLWLQAGDGFIRSWDDPVRLFELLFRRLLCEIDRNIKVTIMCIRCLDRLYAIHASKIGTFTDVMMLVHSMNSTKSIETQHRLLGLLATVLGVVKNEGDDEFANIPENAEQLLNAVSIGQLCQFVAWGHTQGENVGNLLTRALSATEGGKALITDGTGAGPEGSNADEAKSNLAADSSYPRVWFVASTGKVPPPPELIRGPFRLSELVLLMNEGNLTPFDLVTTSHVEEYDSDDANNLIDTGKWTRLKEVWQLRWQLCTEDTSAAIYTPEAVAILALKALTRLVDLHRSLDSRGVPYFPIPTAKRILCGLSSDTIGNMGGKPLAILAQSLLCKDAAGVDQAAELIYKLVQYNEEAMPKLYLTGVFFFATVYTGSNFWSLSKLLHATHLKQNFRSGFAAAAEEDELPMKERSILGNMLPEGLLFVLENYGFERFAEVFVGSSDTPEVIWTLDMRKHLIEMVRQHLGDFPLRLFQNNTTEYEYCPIPGVAYKRLEKEIFCHNYYLENLCDEERFPDWPIAEPVEVFRACLERFKKQVDQDETELQEALKKARALLNLKEDDGSKELRKSYRNLARKYHPDKNPSGREMFESIQVSYELLLPLVESGQTIGEVAGEEDGMPEQGDTSKFAEGFPGGKLQMQTMHLLIQTQLLICRRFEKEMSRYKYPAYRVLLDCLQLPQDCLKALEGEKNIVETSLASPKRASFVHTAVELVYRTCLVSPLNSEELVVESGVSTLVALLNFYIKLCANSLSLAGEKYASYNTLVDTVTFVIRTLSGVAFFDSGRAAIIELQGLSSFLVNWCHCIDGSVFNQKDRESVDASLKRHALEGIINMANDAFLQEQLTGSGVVWPLLRLSLMFDPTLDEEMMGSDCVDDLGVSLAASNVQARLSVRALGMLSGSLEEAPSNDILQNCLARLLTPPVARMLRNKRTGEILRILNTNVESADVIWNISMRNQLETLLSKIEEERPTDVCLPMHEELSVVGEFQYDALRDEVQIGGIYVRVFNKSGKEALSRVANPSKFMAAVTGFVGRSMNHSCLRDGWVSIPVEETEPSVSSEYSSISDPPFLMAVEATRILVRAEGLVDDFLSDTPCIIPSIMFSLLEFPLESAPFDIGCDMLSTLAPMQTFADSVTREGCLWRLLSVLERSEPDEREQEDDTSKDNQPKDTQEGAKRKARGWHVLESLTSSPSVASQLLSTSAWIELLGVLVGYNAFTKLWAARLGAAKTLSRLLWDPVTGSQATPLLQRFLPQSLVMILKEDPETMLRQFDAESDTPELIWGSAMRGELREALAIQLDRCTKERTDESFKKSDLSLGTEARVRYSNLEKELYIGGVYVSRYLKEPTFNLRDPTTFLELLLKRWDQELELFVSKKGAAELPVSSSAITDAEQDILQLVTTAIVYLCKVRETLCDKLSHWGYTARCLVFLPQVLEKDLVGSPLQSIIRILHVASNCLSNIEVLAVSGNSDGHEGFVDYLLQSIGKGKDSLHPDSAFMIDLMKKAYQKALGNVAKAHSSRPVQPSPSLQQVAVSPSPAPGEGPVRKKVSAGDDPLAMMQAPATPASQPQRGQTQQQHGQNPSSYQQCSAMAQQTAPQMRAPQSPAPSQIMGAGLNPTPYNPQHDSVPKSTGAGYMLPNQYTSQSQQHQFPLSYPQGNRQKASTSHQMHHSTQGAQTQYPPNRPYPQQQPEYRQQPQYPPTPQQRQGVPPTGSQHQFQRGAPTTLYTQAPQHPPQQQGQGPQQGSTSGVHALQTPQPGYQQGYPGQAPQQHPTQQQGSASTSQTGPQPQPTLGTRPQTSAGYHQGPQVPQHPPQQPGSGQAGPAHGSQQSYSSRSEQRKHSYQQVPTSQQPQHSQQPHQPYQPSRTPPGAVNPAAPVQNEQIQTGVYRQTPHGYQVPQVSTQQAPPNAVPQSYQAQPGMQRVPQTNIQQAPSNATLQSYQTHPGMQQQGVQQQGVQQQGVQQQGVQQQGVQQQGVQQQGVQQQGTHPSHASGAPIVETVAESEPEPTPQYQPKPIEGSGIDARTREDPKQAAIQQSMSVGGAPGAAQGRIALLQQALACKLCDFLINDVLESPDLKNIKDPAAAKVHAIDLLKLLTKDPGYGPRFKLILKENPAWKKYKSQDHSLYITGHEQRADYFLTDGGTAEKKLLTQGQSS